MEVTGTTREEKTKCSLVLVPAGQSEAARGGPPRRTPSRCHHSRPRADDTHRRKPKQLNVSLEKSTAALCRSAGQTASQVRGQTKWRTARTPSFIERAKQNETRAARKLSCRARRPKTAEIPTRGTLSRRSRSARRIERCHARLDRIYPSFRRQCGCTRFELAGLCRHSCEVWRVLIATASYSVLVSVRSQISYCAPISNKR